MNTKKTTLKDIANICGVTPTVVSAILNRRKGRIAYSDELRDRVFLTAQNIGYKPNILARAMVLQKVPIVACMIHLSAKDLEPDMANDFFQYMLPAISLRLNDFNIETLFIPYSTEEDQFARLQSLVEHGFIGGVITNIIPWAHRSISAYLKKSGLPYMIMGYPQVPDTYCVYSCDEHLWQKVEEFAVSKKCINIYQASMFRNNIEFRKYPFSDMYAYSTSVTELSEKELYSKKNLFAVMGWEVYDKLFEQYPGSGKYILIDEAKNDKFLPKIDRITLDLFPNWQKLADYCVNAVALWMNDEKLPENKIFSFDMTENSTHEILQNTQASGDGK